MKMSLLDMVQSVLNSIDSDDVNSIDDTVESKQVAMFVKECYYELIGQREWPFLKDTFSLQGLGDTTRPTYMELDEDDISKIEWIKYNKKDVTWLDPKDFQDMLDLRVEETGVVDADGFALNRDPLYYTTFDDTYFVFDGYNESVENTLQTSNNLCYGVIVPSWTHEDSFVPRLPEKMFPTLLAEIKSTSAINLRQQANAKEERKAQRGRNTFQNEAWRNKSSQSSYNTKVNYGRR
jgi:hypothetical protein